MEKAPDELVRLREELRRRDERLQAAEALLDGVSHALACDSKTILYMLTVFSSAVIEDYADQLDEEGRDYLDRIRRSAEQMRRLIDDLVQALQEHQNERAREPLNSNTVVSEGCQPTRTPNKQNDRGKRFALRNPVCERITIETVQEGELYVTYFMEDERVIGPVGYYVDELDAREGHLRWIKPNWHDPPPAAQRPFRLLLAEDNPDDVTIARRVFGASPQWELVVVGDGQQALDVLCRYRHGVSSDESVWFPDLVMLNLQMPKRTGHEVLEAMKADPKLNALPVVMWSVSNRREDIERTHRLRADVYICKLANAQCEVAKLTAIRRFWERVLHHAGGRT